MISQRTLPAGRAGGYQILSVPGNQALRCRAVSFMAKVLDEPVEMLSGAESHIPLGFVWRGQERRISEWGGQWRARGRWWLGEGPRCYFRITTLENMVMDLCLDEASQVWTVAVIHD